jgi:hypothetical protein
MTITDPTFYRSPAEAIAAPTEQLGYVVAFDRAGGSSLDERFFPHGEDFRGWRPHQVRRQKGDASSDSYCYR